MKYKFGSLVWVYLGRAIEVSASTHAFQDGKANSEMQSSPFTVFKLEGFISMLNACADIATLVARHNVLESIYQHWSGMSLDPDYKAAIIELCVFVLTYIARFFNPGLAAHSKTKVLAPQMAKIVAADAKCRGFTVTFSVDRKFEEVSEDDSDSDSTVNTNKTTKRSFDDSSENCAEMPLIQAAGLDQSSAYVGVSDTHTSKRIRT